METVLFLFTLQAILGAFDGIYHHEITEKLSLNSAAKTELLLHALRSSIYAVIFITLAGLQWNGVFAYMFAVLLVVELGITLTDFVIEDKTRDLPASERITHTILTLNYGAILALLIPLMADWSRQATSLVIVDHGVLSALFLLFALGVSVMALREFYLFRRLALKTAYQPNNVALHSGAKRYLITGATGFIGQQLTRRLLSQHHQVCILARDWRKIARLFSNSHRLTIISSIDQLEEHDYFDVIINLAGEPLASGMWNNKKKMRILQSRITLTSQLVNFIRYCKRKPEVFISGSAIGYYGSQQDSLLDESSRYDNSFSSQLCRQWENVAIGAEAYGVRTCLLRTGLVLGDSGGMLGSMLFPFWYGLGGKFGNGRQWMSWISIEDLLNIIEYIVNNVELSGAVNATSPNPVTNASFTRTLANVLHRPAIFSIPAFLLRRLLGQAADELFLSSARVLPGKLAKTGYQFVHPELLPTLKGLLAK